jgi:hypothetical protein
MPEVVGGDEVGSELLAVLPKSFPLPDIAAKIVSSIACFSLVAMIEWTDSDSIQGFS